MRRGTSSSDPGAGTGFVATSAEGRFAQNLMKGNSDSLARLECKKDVRHLGVALEVARRSSILGLCTIWVEPVEKCRFKN